jgi:hypothetical protein
MPIRAATTHVYRYFAGDSDNQNIQAIARSDAVAAQLVKGYSDISSVRFVGWHDKRRKAYYESRGRQ